MVAGNKSLSGKSARADKTAAKRLPTRNPAVSPTASSSDWTFKCPLEVQQRILATFSTAFAHLLSLDAIANVLQPLLQEVKQHLYYRAFQLAFGNPDYLQAYAARWSPSRALGYLQIFVDVLEYLEPLLSSSPHNEPSVIAPDETFENTPKSNFNAVCLGGGAGAEICAFAGLLRVLSDPTISPTTKLRYENLRFKIAAFDMADYLSSAVMPLTQCLTTPPPLSKYTSASVRASNCEFVSPTSFSVDFVQQNLLVQSGDETAEQRFREALSNADIVTLMFTLNELYTVSVPATQQLLLNMTAAIQAGSLLLVVDSPGSYSTVTINEQEKKYPMHWLLDHTLLAEPEQRRTRADDAVNPNTIRKSLETPKWEKLITHESRWFRLPEGLRYPLELEDMRFQMHMYRRL